MKSSNLYPPIFSTYPALEDTVRVTLLNENVASEWEKVSSFLEMKKYITNEEARHITGVVQRDKMSRLLKGWVKQGLLLKIEPRDGYLKATKYRLSANKGKKICL